MMTRFLYLGSLGLLTDLTFGALKNLITQKDLGLRGETSLWKFPLYGLIPFLFPLISNRVEIYPWWGRGLVYMAAFFLIEYLAHWIYEKLRIQPWSYSGRYALQGRISLLHAPVWFGGGLLIEWIYPFITM
ncbi:MAG: hypothetical protein HY540_02135 [Deltaproteobacteria bacterium]|nr:hypothetical protein [Deltaproteobacteria bacterium]